MFTGIGKQKRSHLSGVFVEVIRLMANHTCVCVFVVVCVCVCVCCKTVYVCVCERGMERRVGEGERETGGVRVIEVLADYPAP